MPDTKREHASVETFDGRTHELVAVELNADTWRVRKIVNTTLIEGSGATAVAAVEDWGAKYKAACDRR